MTSSRQAAQVARALHREQDRQLAARPGNPLSPGVFLVEVANRVAALRVLGPGSAELATAGGPPARLGVRAAKSGRLWRRRLRLFCADGERIVLPFAPGEYGIGEVGRAGLRRGAAAGPVAAGPVRGVLRAADAPAAPAHAGGPRDQARVRGSG